MDQGEWGEILRGKEERWAYIWEPRWRKVVHRCARQDLVGPRNKMGRTDRFGAQANGTRRGGRERGLGSNKFPCHCLGKGETRY